MSGSQFPKNGEAIAVLQLEIERDAVEVRGAQQFEGVSARCCLDHEMTCLSCRACQGASAGYDHCQRQAAASSDSLRNRRSSVSEHSTWQSLHQSREALPGVDLPSRKAIAQIVRCRVHRLYRSWLAGRGHCRSLIKASSE
jgi:hypothetical protein